MHKARAPFPSLTEPHGIFGGPDKTGDRFLAPDKALLGYWRLRQNPPAFSGQPTKPAPGAISVSR